MVEIVAFASAFAHTGEHRNAAMKFGDVVDQLHDDDSLAYARATKCANFAAFEEGTYQVDDFDTRGQDLWRSGLILERRRQTMNGIKFVGFDWSAFVDGSAG